LKVSDEITIIPQGKNTQAKPKVPVLVSLIWSFFTGKSLSEALLFAEHGENILCTKIVLNVKNNFFTQHVPPFLSLEFSCIEQSVVILWVSWCKRQRFTCIDI
jgi:hypothetical protein